MNQESNTWVIMPVLDELENLKWLLPKLSEKYHVLIVDNGSTDGSYEYCLDNGIKVIKESIKGYGKAVLSGIEHLSVIEPSDNKVVVVFDADGTSPIESIDSVVSPITQEGFDFVIGQRTFSQLGAIPLHAKFGNWLTVFLIKLSTGHSYKDMGPLRAIKLKKINKMNMIDQNYGWNVEMQMKAVKHGLKIKEVDIKYFRRRHGKSKISGSVLGSIKAGIKILSRVVYFHFYLKKNKTWIQIPIKQDR